MHRTINVRRQLLDREECSRRQNHVYLIIHRPLSPLDEDGRQETFNDTRHNQWLQDVEHVY